MKKVAAGFNTAHVLVCWNIGNRIRKDILRDARAGYGQQIIATLSQYLTGRFGAGFSRSAPSRMVKFSELYLGPRIVATLSHQLSWSRFVELLPLKDGLQRKRVHGRVDGRWERK